MTEEQTPQSPENPPAEPTPTPPPADSTPAATPPKSPAPPAHTAGAPVPAPSPMPPAVAPQPVATKPGRPRGRFLGTGRRKSSVARVQLIPGSGQITINKREVDRYFTEAQDQTDVRAPLDVTGVGKNWDILVRVHGGGHTGQAGAIRLGIARALVQADRQFEPTLRDAGYLTRDARRVERKKYGQRKARRRFQFSKR